MDAEAHFDSPFLKTLSALGVDPNEFSEEEEDFLDLVQSLVSKLERWLQGTTIGALTLKTVGPGDIAFAKEREDEWLARYEAMNEPFARTDSDIKNILEFELELSGYVDEWKIYCREILGGFLLTLSSWEKWQTAAS